MARRRRNTTKTKKTRAYTPTIPKRSRLRSSKFDRTINTYNNRFVEDRRTYKPYLASPRTLSNTPARVTTSTTFTKPIQGKKPHSINTRVQTAFAVPKRVITCVRRQQRKEVLHALKHTGKGGQRRPKRTPLSNINCK